MKQAYDIVAQRVAKRQASSKVRYDKKPASAVLQPGDRVLVRNLSERGGPGKLRNFWEKVIHVVVKRCNQEGPVYTVKPETGNGRTRTLHRNMLLPCDFRELDPELPSRKMGSARVRQNPGRTQIRPTTEASDSESDESDEEWHIQPPKLPVVHTASRTLRPNADEFIPRGQHQTPGFEVPAQGGTHHQRYPQRERRPPLRMTYDEAGNVTNYGIYPEVYQQPAVAHVYYPNHYPVFSGTECFV